MIYQPWRPIEGFITKGGFKIPDNYEISFRGRIRRKTSYNSVPTGYRLRVRYRQRGTRGYFLVQLGHGHNESKVISVNVLMERYWPEIAFKPSSRWMKWVNSTAEIDNTKLLNRPTIHRTRPKGAETHKKTRQNTSSYIPLQYDPWAGGRTLSGETRQPDFSSGF